MQPIPSISAKGEDKISRKEASNYLHRYHVPRYVHYSIPSSEVSDL